MVVGEPFIATKPWIADLQEFVKPYWNQLLEGPWAEGIVHGNLTLPQMQGWILQLYPFIHAFPKYLAEALIKVEDDDSRAFFINNIRVERAHAEHWLWMGEGFGLKREAMLALAEGNTPLLCDVQSLNDWLWHVNTKGSLAEAVAATSFAIEGIAGDIARKVPAGFQHYKDQPGVDLSPKTYRWMRQHAHYDDVHPKIAMEIVERYATTERVRQRVMFAAKRSLELLDQALVTAYQAYSINTTSGTGIEKDWRIDRRKKQIPINFPDRRHPEGRELESRIAA